MNERFIKQTLAAAVVAVVSNQALAIEPAEIDLGPITLTPTLKLAEAYNDNVDEDARENASWVTEVSPTFVLAAQDRLNVYSLTYSFDSEIFHSQHDDDNTDHHLTADAHLEFNSRNRLDLNAGYHDVEDTDDADSSTGENDQYHTSNIGAVYGFGAQSATMQLEFGVNHEAKRYDNSGTLNDGKERDTDSLSGIAYYRLAPKTRALFEMRYSDFDYVSNDPLNSYNLTYLGGITWSATARTSGSLKLGYEEKDFDDADKKDPGGTVWEVSVTWAPRTYSSFTLSTNRGFDEGGDTGEDYIETTATRLEWNHDWNSYVSSNVYYSYTEEEYQGIDRDDDTSVFAMGLTWELRRWMDVGLGYKYTDKDSTYSSESYNQNLYQASLNLSF